MFGKVTRHLVSETDPDGALLAVSRLTDTGRLQPLGVVLKSPRRWPWQRAKYRPTDFTLAHITQGRRTLRPVLVQSDFLSYEGTYAGSLQGAVGARVGGVRVTAEGAGSSTLQSSLGRLLKEAVDVNRLVNDSKDRLVDLQHPLVQQSLRKKKVISVLKQRILTAKACSVRYHGLGAGSCAAMLALRRTGPLQVSVNENASVQMDSDVSMEIPAHTVLAYSVIELRIKRNRQYELCLQADVQGGFDCALGRTNNNHDASHSLMDEVDSPSGETHPGITAGESLSTQNIFVDLAHLKGDLSVLCDLDSVTRSSLSSLIGSSLLDKDVLSSLEEWLDDWCSGEAADAPESQDQRVQALVNLVRSVTANQKPPCEVPLSHNGKHAATSNTEPGSSSPSANQASASSKRQVDGQLIGSALHLLVSALLELTADCLNLIQSCCSAGLLPPLSQLLDDLMASQPLPLDAVPPLLRRDEAFSSVASLLRSAGLQLVTQADRLLLVAEEAAGFQPLTVCVVVRGFACLSSGRE